MGVGMLCNQLNWEEFTVERTQVGTLMECMGSEALYRMSGTSKKHPGMNLIST